MPQKITSIESVWAAKGNQPDNAIVATASGKYPALDGSLITNISGGVGDVATDAIWDTKGDLAGGTGADAAARIAVGTNGQVLTADSAQATGMKWATGGGGGGTLDPLYIIGLGQSNMTGWAPLDSGFVTDSNVKVWSSESNDAWETWDLAADPRQTNSTPLGYDCWAWWFAKRLADSTGREVRVLMAASGNTGVTSFHSPSGSNYLKLTVQLALAGIPSDGVAALLWHQGEYDWNQTVGWYATEFATMRADMEALAAIPTRCPMIIGEMANGTYASTQNGFFDTLLDDDTGKYYVMGGTRLLAQLAEGDVHFSSESLRRIGSHYAWRAWNAAKSTAGAGDIATNVEALTGSSDTTISPSNVLFALANRGFDCAIDNSAVVGTTASGVTYATPAQWGIGTGTPVGGSGYARSNMGQFSLDATWSGKALLLDFMLNRVGWTANGKFWVGFGYGAATTARDPLTTEPTIGFRIDSLEIKGICHDGAGGAITVVDLATSAGVNTRFSVTVDGNTGAVEWFVDGLSKGTSSAGPTGSVGQNYWAYYGASDGGDSGQQFFRGTPLKLIIRDI